MSHLHDTEKLFIILTKLILQRILICNDDQWRIECGGRGGSNPPTQKRTLEVISRAFQMFTLGNPTFIAHPVTITIQWRFFLNLWHSRSHSPSLFNPYPNCGMTEGRKELVKAIVNSSALLSKTCIV